MTTHSMRPLLPRKRDGHRIRPFFLLAVAGLIAWPAPGAATAEPAAGLAAAIDAYVRPFADTGHLSGSLLVAHGDEVVYERGFGRADYELDVPVGPDTRFCVASINKPMTIIIAIRLLEAEKLGLKDPVAKWLPGFPSGEVMTVEHLLQHRAGVPHRLVEGEATARAWSAAELVDAAKGQPLAFAPGSQESYSSGGFSVLARILELASGQSYEELLAEHVFGPAGMTGSAHGAHAPLMPNRASSYYFGPTGDFVNGPPKDVSYLVGAGAVYSTARDLLALMRAVVSGRLGERVRQSLVRENGLRWNGLTHGFRAFADWHGESDTYVVLTANVQSGAGDHLRSNLPRLVAGEEAEPVPELAVRPFPVAPATLAGYEGVYELRPGRTMELRVEGPAMRMDEWILLPTSQTTFFSPQDYGLITVVLGAEGAVERLDWGRGDDPFPMPRVGDLERR